mmetsp:Transcript_64470/g.155517  ORF Transcript_64470/g.155517 Transcript_64470/m.155517 type:complete len:233 (+) Transcript_64470:705-1403(+)
MLAAELGALPEDLLNHRVVLHVPVYPRLRHEHGDVPLERVVVQLERSLDQLVVALQPRILNVLGEPSQGVDVLLGEVVELAVGLCRRGLHHERRVEELVERRVEELVGEVRVLGEHVGGEVEVLVLAVEQQKVGEGLGREGRVLDEEVELAEALRGEVLHVHQRRVVQRHRVELLLASGRHVRERLARGVVVLHLELDGGLEVECLYEGRLLEHGRVAHGAHLDALGLRSYG